MNFRRATGRLAGLATLAIGVGLITAAPSFAVHQTVLGLQTDDEIVSFAVGMPGTLTSGPTAITGVALTDDVVGIDYRPRNNLLYAFGADTGGGAGTVYILTPPTMTTPTYTASEVGSLASPNAVDSGVDFNPMADALRVNNIDNENFRYNPNTGAPTVDQPLVFAPGDSNNDDDPQVGAAAYTNNFDGATSTTLFDLEALNNVLVTQNPPNEGVLNTVGTLPGGDITSVAGFDIETQTGAAYAALQTATEPMTSRFYRLDLANGSALSTFGAIGGGELIESVTLPPIPVLQFANAVTSVGEGDAATVTVNRQGPLNQQATVRYATELAADDAASAGDFTAATGTLTFASGDSQESFTVQTTGDTTDELDESLTVRLSMPSTSVNLPTPPTSKVNIVDDDDAPAAGGGGTGGGTGGTGTGTGDDDDAGPPRGLISIPSQKVDRKLKAFFSCDQACDAKIKLRLGKRKLDTVNDSLGAAGNKRINFQLRKPDLKKAKKKAEGRKPARFTIKGRFSDEDGSTKTKFKFELG